MKKTLALAIITLATLANTTRAQSLTFDETVKYISNKFAKYTNYTVRIEVSKNGDVIEFNEDDLDFARFNLFDVAFTYELRNDEWKLVYSCSSGQHCIKRHDSDGEKRFGDEMYGKVQTRNEAEKIIKAYNYLRTLCKKEVDPFN